MRNTYLATAMNPVLIPSLEDLAPDGVTRVEKELEIYGTLRDMSVLEQATGWEAQEQWGLYIPKTAKNGGSGGPRVRKTTKSTGEITFVLTTKVKEVDGNKECEQDTSEDMFKLFRQLAESGLLKKRFFFPIGDTGLKFEVDVFCGNDGQPVPEVKIDLEIPEDLAPNFDPSQVKLPFEMDNVRIIAPGRKNEEDLKYVRKLFSEKYDVPNPHLAAPQGQASMEEFPPPGCTCGTCGWHDTKCLDKCTSMEEFAPAGCDCPSCVEKQARQRSYEPRAVPAQGIESEERSEDNLLTNKAALIEIASQAEGIGNNLSMNGPEHEVRLKNSLHDIVVTVGAVFNA